MALLANVSSSEMKSLGIEALRNWRSTRPRNQQTDPMREETGDVFQIQSNFGVELIRLLATQAGITKIDLVTASTALGDDDMMALSWLSPIVEFLWWLARAGIAVALGCGTKRNDRGYSWDVPRCYPTAMRLTTRGVALLNAKDDDPLLPGYLDRIRKRCPDIPEAVLALLVDARSCLDYSLFRPSIVLMGVAYEVAIAKVVESLSTRNLVKPNTPTLDASERLKRIVTLLDDDAKAKNDMKLTSEERGLARAAYHFADLLRGRRNDGAHAIPALDFEHRGETEEYFVSAARYLPGIWLICENRHDPSFERPNTSHV
jgi:hypothetical protein